MRELPEYLRPAPRPATRRGRAPPQSLPPPGARGGRRNPRPESRRGSRGHTGGFLTDAIARARSYATPQSRSTRPLPHAACRGQAAGGGAVEQGRSTRSSSPRATAERYGLGLRRPRRSSASTWRAANLVSVGSRRAATRSLPVAFVRREHAPARDGRPDQPARRSTTSRWRPDSTCAVAVAAAGDDIEVADHAAQHACRTPSPMRSREEAEAEEDRGGARRDHATCARQAEDGPVDEAGQQHPRPGRRRRAPPTSTSSPRTATCASASRSTASCRRSCARAEADGRGGDLADQDHERAWTSPRSGFRRTAAWASRIDDRRVDLRVTTLPDPDWRRGVDPHPRRGGRAQRTLDDLGMDGDQRSALRETRFRKRLRRRAGHRSRPAPASRRPSTPRLQELNEVDKHIVTIEDPVEYQARRRQPDRRQSRKAGPRRSPRACARSCGPTRTSIMVGEDPGQPRRRGSRSRPR